MDPPNVECGAATSAWEPGVAGLVGSHTPFPFRSLEKEPRGLLRAGSRRCFPTPGVVAVEECERALRNLVDTRNLSGE